MDDVLYKEMITQEDKIPFYRMHGVPGNNILISPIRLTQRMIKTVPNMN